MAVTPLSPSNTFQRSVWSMDLPSPTHKPESFNTNDGSDNEIKDISKTDQQKPTSSKASSTLSFILGLSLGGIAVVVVLALWLSPTKMIITTTISTTTTSITTTTTSSTSTTSDTSTTSVTTTTTVTTTSTVTTTTTTIITPAVNVFWGFDGNTNDLYHNYNGVAFNGPVYVTGYTGQSNTALYFDGSASQYVTIPSLYVDLTYKSFTVEMWFYPIILTSNDYGLFGQCQTTAQDLCMIYMIRNYRLLLAFESDDTSGMTPICINQWYHVAFVYDYATSTQLVYLNGLLESSGASNPYKGASGDIFIGAINNGLRYYFTGYIDQVSLMTRTKSAAEILKDATLVCYYSFDSSLYTDSGPLGLSASSVNVPTASSVGRINTAISFIYASSYFIVGELTKLGVVGQSYSISIWIKPISVSGGTIIHVSRCNSSCGSNWCLAFIGFTSSGQIAIQSWSGTYGNNLVVLTGPVISVNVWTHVVQTYSSTNGMRLFLNGTLYNQSTIFIYSASNTPDYIYLGSFPLTACVGTNVISMNQYYGLMDEFRVFTRDITPAEIYGLANP